MIPAAAGPAGIIIMFVWFIRSFPSEGQLAPFSPYNGSLVMVVHYSKVDYIKSLLRKNYGEIRMRPQNNKSKSREI